MKAICLILPLAMFILVSSSTPQEKKWATPESNLSSAEIAGAYYAGDGLGTNIYLQLAADGSFYQSWHGCLGLYGESCGKWNLRDSIISLVRVLKTGALADFPDSLATMRFQQQLALLPVSHKYRAQYEEFGADRTVLLTKDARYQIPNASALGDINCDGIDDLVVGVNDDTAFTIRLFAGPLADSSKPSTLSFPQHSDSCRFCLCGTFGSFDLEVSSDLDSILDTLPAGFLPDPRCAQIVVFSPDGECDRFHCYWNHTSKRLDWWSL